MVDRLDKLGSGMVIGYIKDAKGNVTNVNHLPEDIITPTGSVASP